MSSVRRAYHSQIHERSCMFNSFPLSTASREIYAISGYISGFLVYVPWLQFRPRLNSRSAELRTPATMRHTNVPWQYMALRCSGGLHFLILSTKDIFRDNFSHVRYNDVVAPSLDDDDVR